MEKNILPEPLTIGRKTRMSLTMPGQKLCDWHFTQTASPFSGMMTGSGRRMTHISLQTGKTAACKYNNLPQQLQSEINCHIYTPSHTCGQVIKVVSSDAKGTEFKPSAGKRVVSQRKTFYQHLFLATQLKMSTNVSEFCSWLVSHPKGFCPIPLMLEKLGISVRAKKSSRLERTKFFIYSHQGIIYPSSHLT